MKPCPKCGADNGDSALECHACSVVFERYGKHALRRPKRTSASIAVVLAALAVVVIGVVLANIDPSEPQPPLAEETVDTADSAEAIEDEAVEPARVAEAQVVIVPTNEAGRWFADVYLLATDNKAQPTRIEGEAELRWGIVQPNQHRETVLIGEWRETELPNTPGIQSLHTRLHRIPYDPDTARGMPLRVIVSVEGLEVEESVQL